MVWPTGGVIRARTRSGTGVCVGDDILHHSLNADILGEDPSAIAIWGGRPAAGAGGG